MQTIHEEGILRVPVLASDRLVGIISRSVVSSRRFEVAMTLILRKRGDYHGIH